MALGIALVITGLVVAGVTLWFWRESRPDNPVLGPLEVIGERAFKDADEATRKEMLRRARSTVGPLVSTRKRCWLDFANVLRPCVGVRCRQLRGRSVSTSSPKPTSTSKILQ